MLGITWLKTWKIRAFSTLESGINVLEAETTSTEGHTFQVGKSTGFEAPQSVVWSQVGDKTPLDILAIGTDGEFIYYAQGNFVIRASRSGLKLAERDLGGVVNSLSVDGFAVVAGTAAQAGAEVYNLDRLTLADRASWPLEVGASITDLASDGNALVYVDGSVSATTYSHAGALVATLGHGATVQAVAMDWQYIYVGGLVSGGFQIRAFLRGGGGAIWSVAIQGGTPTIIEMVSDGERLFITTTTVNDVGHLSNIRCLRTFDGVRLWRTLTPNTDPADTVVVDEKYLYTGDANGQAYLFDKKTGDCVGAVAHTDSISQLAVDGDAIFMGGVEDGAIGVIRWSRGNGTKQYVKADSADINRRPFYNLAIPAEY